MGLRPRCVLHSIAYARVDTLPPRKGSTSTGTRVTAMRALILQATASDRHPGQWLRLRREGNALQLGMEMRGVSLGPNMQSTDARALVCTP
jgi:hypothetical protein